MNYIVLDIDGTLCNSNKRVHHAINKEWDKFHEALGDDEPYKDVSALIKLLQSNDKVIIIACTGRPEKYRAETISWFLENKIYVDQILMRPNDNYEKDHVIKPRLLFENFGGKENALNSVDFILEDRDKLVDEWRSLGFNCWQVRPSSF